VGSITHTEGFCTAVVAAKSRFAGLGVDAERVQNVSGEVWPQILRREEVDRFLQLEVAERQKAAAVVFCAKEAFYKCQYAVTGAWLDFTDVAVEIFEETFRVTVQGRDCTIPKNLRSLNGRYLQDGNLIVAGVALSADRLPSHASVEACASLPKGGRMGQEY
jgi:4'-phosphopantetheinyl transferase EntD